MMRICPNAGGECVSATCDGGGPCWKQSESGLEARYGKAQVTMSGQPYYPERARRALTIIELNHLVFALDRAINSTPTGILREQMTELNIAIRLDLARGYDA